MTFQPGTALGPYQILAPLGAGGMGEVYRARDTRLGREVAIKTLPDSLAQDPERLARFRREAETLAALNHPNIATIFGLEQVAGVLVLAMELVEGPTIAERLARGPMPIDESLPLARDLTLALDAAHERAIIHRDLKPANIKLTAGGSVKLLDFGLAKALEAGSGAAIASAGAAGLSASPTMSVMATQAGVLLGTAAYMSPEQVRAASVDKRADIWAFGVVLTEMLTGRGLFGGDTISDTLAGVLREPIDLDRLPASTPRSIRQLIARCLERDSKQRLRDIGEARIAIENVLANPNADALDPAATLARRSQWMGAVPWVLSAVLIAMLGALLLRRTAPSTAASSTVVEFAVDLGSLAPMRGGNTGGFVAVSADGRRIFISARSADGPRGQQRLYQRTLDRPEFTPVPGSEESGNPFASPDGEWVGFESGGQLKKVSLTGGVAIPICQAAGVAGATWLDDDTIVFAMGGRLYRVPAGGGTPEPLATPPPSERYAWPAAIGGHRAVLFTVRPAVLDGARRSTFRVAALDLATRKQYAIADAATFPRFVDGLVVYSQQGVDDPSTPFPGRLLAVPFDAKSLAVTGPPVRVRDDVLVFSGGAGHYDVAANGMMVFLTRALASASRDLAWLTPAASGDAAAAVLEPVKGTNGAVTIPRLSHDERRIVMQVGFSGTGALYSFTLDRGSMERIPFDGEINEPIIGPGDESVTLRAAGGLFTVPIDGSRPAQRLTSTGVLVPGAWTRDGAKLVVTQLHPRGGDLMVLNRGDDSPQPLLVTDSDERSPALSPDERWLAYTSNESGRYEVYVRRFGPEGGRSAVSADGGELPMWSKDGRHLFYVHEATTLMAVDVTATSRFAASAPRSVASGNFTLRTLGLRAAVARSFDIAADGRILLVRSTDAIVEGAAAHVILNIGADIHRRLVTSKPGTQH